MAGLTHTVTVELIGEEGGACVALVTGWRGLGPVAVAEVAPGTWRTLLPARGVPARRDERPGTDGWPALPALLRAALSQEV